MIESLNDKVGKGWRQRNTPEHDVCSEGTKLSQISGVYYFVFSLKPNHLFAIELLLS